MELIAHRGASRERRENTLPAFERAIELGADGIELDTHITRDGVVIVHHDEAPRAESSTSGLAGQPFASLTASDVRTFRFPDGSGIPTLEETIDLVGDRVILYIELKAREIEHAVLRCLHARPARFALHSFDHASVKRVRSGAGDGVRTGVLTCSYLLEPERALEHAGATDYWQSQDLVDEALVQRVHAAGGRVIVWTVNRAEQAAELEALGVDGVCTDDLRTVGRAIGRTA
jgi:glycerophosphoryl diester phosphodiesterase